MFQPWNRTGLNSMISAVQLISHPITPVKNGIVISLIHSLVLTAGLSASFCAEWRQAHPTRARPRQNPSVPERLALDAR